MPKASTFTLPNGNRIEIGPEPGHTTIGRGSNIPIEEVYVSREHLEVKFESDGVAMIRDIGSRNGTHAQRGSLELSIGSKFQQLYDGDEIYLGGTRAGQGYKIVYNTRIDLESERRTEERLRNGDTAIIE